MLLGHLRVYEKYAFYDTTRFSKIQKNVVVNNII